MDGPESQWADVLCALHVCVNLKSLKFQRLRCGTHDTEITNTRFGDVAESEDTYVDFSV